MNSYYMVILLEMQEFEKIHWGKKVEGGTWTTRKKSEQLHGDTV